MSKNPRLHQKYKNAYKFKHNKKSKLTEKILSSPITHVCDPCRRLLEWKKAYRKYKVCSNDDDDDNDGCIQSHDF